MKRALITGITGQDGSYLAELLLEKGYEVHGVIRRSSSMNTGRINHIYDNPNLKLHYGDVTDSLTILNILKKYPPDEIYNLAAQSHVAVSFETPEYTATVDALGTLKILESVRILNLDQYTKDYIVEVYTTLTGNHTHKLMDFLNYKSEQNEFCS